LPATVLADDRVHLTALDGDVNVVVGDDTGETLRDAAELDSGRDGTPLRKRRRGLGDPARISEPDVTDCGAGCDRSLLLRAP
jgi:hypothetical protein